MLGANNISAVNNEIIKAILTSMVGGGTNGAFNAASRFFTKEAVKKFITSNHENTQKYENKQSEYKNYLPQKHMDGEPSFLQGGKENNIGTTKYGEMSYAYLANSPGIFEYEDGCSYLSVKYKTKKKQMSKSLLKKNRF